MKYSQFLGVALRREYLTLATRINHLPVPMEDIGSWLEREEQSDYPTQGAWGWDGHYKLQYRLASAIDEDVRRRGVAEFLAEYIKPDNARRWRTRVDATDTWNIYPLLKLMHLGGADIYEADECVVIHSSEGTIAIKDGELPAADGSHFLDLLLFNWLEHRRRWRRVKKYLIETLRADLHAETSRLTEAYGRAVAVTSDGHAVEADQVFRRDGQAWVDITSQAQANKISLSQDAFELRERTCTYNGDEDIIVVARRHFDNTNGPVLLQVGGAKKQHVLLVG